MDWLLVTLAVSATVLMVWLDEVRFGTWLTPTTILAGPHMGIALLAFVIGPPLGYVPLYTPSLVVWTCYVAIFWGTGQIATGFLPKAALCALPHRNEESARPFALAAAWVAIPLLVYGSWSASQTVGGLQDFRGAEYRDATLNGWLGHLLVVTYPLFIYLIGAVRKKNAAFCGVSAGLLLIVMVLRPTKSWVLLPIVAGLLYRARMGRFRLTLGKTVAIVALIYCLFNISYLIAFGAADPQTLRDTDIYAELFRHFGDYFFAGILGFSGHLQHGGAYVADRATAYAPFINIAGLITGRAPVSPVLEQFTTIRSGADGFQGNVHTLFGTLIMTLGYLEAGLYTFVLSLVSHAAFVASVRSRDVWITALWCFIAAGLAFAWFEIYFSQLALLEVPAVCLLFSAIGRTTERAVKPMSHFT